MRSPMPARPENVSGRAPEAVPRRAISRRPRLMRPALALSPRPRPSTPPAARAMTFLVAAQSSTPTRSSFAYTRRAGEISACCSSTASSGRRSRRPPRPATPARSPRRGSGPRGPQRAELARAPKGGGRCPGRDPSSASSTGQSSRQRRDDLGESRGSGRRARPGRPAPAALRRRSSTPTPERSTSREVARVPARRGDRGACAGSRQASVTSCPRSRSSVENTDAPRTSTDDDDVHGQLRRTKSITTGIPASAKRSRMRFSTQ